MLETILKDIKKGNYLTKFLTLEEQKQLKEMHLFLSFSCEQLERKRAYIASNDERTIHDYHISLYRIDYSKKYYTLNHRDVLGALMSLGITRESIGDILCLDNQEIYIIVASEIEKYISLNLTTIKNAMVSLEKCSLELLNQLQVTNEIEDEMIVSSLRLDVIVSECMHLSREKAKQYIVMKNVKVNGMIETRPDRNIEMDDLLSIHRYGRLVLKEVVKKTKKDKYVIRVTHTK